MILTSCTDDVEQCLWVDFWGGGALDHALDVITHKA
jgi:hypothetical protein